MLPREVTSIGITHSFWGRARQFLTLFIFASLVSCSGGGGSDTRAPPEPNEPNQPNEPNKPPPPGIDNHSLAAAGSMHGSNRSLEVFEIEGGVDMWLESFSQADFTLLPYGERPVWHLKTQSTVPSDAYIAEIKYVVDRGYRVISTMKLLEGERLTAPVQRTELLQRIDLHIDTLCNAGACPDVFSVDNEPDIDPSPEQGSLDLWNAYSLTLDTIAEGLIAAKREHGVEIALPAIGLFGHWQEFGSQAVALMGERMQEFSIWLFHVYDHPPGFQSNYNLSQIARLKTGNPTIEVVASETAVGFVKAGESPEDKPWIQGKLGAVYFAAQIASSVMSGIKPCHFLLINVNSGIIRRPDLDPTLRQQVSSWIGQTLFAPGFFLDPQRSSITLDSFHIVTSNGQKDRLLEGRYIPRFISRSVGRALLMKHFSLSRTEIESLAGIEDEAREIEMSFAVQPIPDRPPQATLLHQMSYQNDVGDISWFIIEETPVSPEQ